MLHLIVSNDQPLDWNQIIDLHRDPAYYTLTASDKAKVFKRTRSTGLTPTRRMMRTKAAAQYLGASEWKLRQLVHEGKIRHLRHRDGECGPWWFDQRDLDEYLERNKE
jgi:excisionase family DNA binding protein